MKDEAINFSKINDPDELWLSLSILSTLIRHAAENDRRSIFTLFGLRKSEVHQQLLADKDAAKYRMKELGIL